MPVKAAASLLTNRHLQRREEKYLGNELALHVCAEAGTNEGSIFEFGGEEKIHIIQVVVSMWYPRIWLAWRELYRIWMTSEGLQYVGIDVQSSIYVFHYMSGWLCDGIGISTVCGDRQQSM